MPNPYPTCPDPSGWWLAGDRHPALVYLARLRNLFISLAIISLQAGLTVIFILIGRDMVLPELYIAVLPALALSVALLAGSLARSFLLARLAGASVSVWRMSLVFAASQGVADYASASA